MLEAGGVSLPDLLARQAHQTVGVGDGQGIFLPLALAVVARGDGFNDGVADGLARIIQSRQVFHRSRPGGIRGLAGDRDQVMILTGNGILHGLAVRQQFKLHMIRPLRRTLRQHGLAVCDHAVHPDLPQFQIHRRFHQGVGDGKALGMGAFHAGGVALRHLFFLHGVNDRLADLAIPVLGQIGEGDGGGILRGGNANGLHRLAVGIEHHLHALRRPQAVGILVVIPNLGHRHTGKHIGMDIGHRQSATSVRSGNRRGVSHHIGAAEEASAVLYCLAVIQLHHGVSDGLAGLSIVGRQLGNGVAQALIMVRPSGQHNRCDGITNLVYGRLTVCQEQQAYILPALILIILVVPNLLYGDIHHLVLIGVGEPYGGIPGRHGEGGGILVLSGVAIHLNLGLNAVSVPLIIAFRQGDGSAVRDVHSKVDIILQIFLRQNLHHRLAIRPLVADGDLKAIRQFAKTSQLLVYRQLIGLRRVEHRDGAVPFGDGCGISGVIAFHRGLFHRVDDTRLLALHQLVLRQVGEADRLAEVGDGKRRYGLAVRILGHSFAVCHEGHGHMIRADGCIIIQPHLLHGNLHHLLLAAVGDSKAIHLVAGDDRGCVAAAGQIRYFLHGINHGPSVFDGRQARENALISGLLVGAAASRLRRSVQSHLQAGRNRRAISALAFVQAGIPHLLVQFYRHRRTLAVHIVLVVPDLLDGDIRHGGSQGVGNGDFIRFLRNRIPNSNHTRLHISCCSGPCGLAVQFNGLRRFILSAVPGDIARHIFFHHLVDDLHTGLAGFVYRQIRPGGGGLVAASSHGDGLRFRTNAHIHGP